MILQSIREGRYSAVEPEQLRLLIKSLDPKRKIPRNCGTKDLVNVILELDAVWLRYGLMYHIIYGLIVCSPDYGQGYDGF